MTDRLLCALVLTGLFTAFIAAPALLILTQP